MIPLRAPDADHRAQGNLLKCLMLLASTSLFIAVAACAAEDYRSRACLSPETKTLYVTLVNPLQHAVTVPDRQLGAACCNASFSIHPLDANGAPAKRCALGTGFPDGKTVRLQPGESRRYSYSMDELSAVYCNYSLKGRTLRLIYGYNRKPEAPAPHWDITVDDTCDTR